MESDPSNGNGCTMGINVLDGLETCDVKCADSYVPDTGTYICDGTVDGVLATTTLTCTACSSISIDNGVCATCETDSSCLTVTCGDGYYNDRWD
eukprot:UN05158